jgi:hypothetical protein
VALPESFGLSNGILSAGFAAWAVMERTWRRILAFVAIGIVTAGTTITNGLFFATCLAHWRVRSIRTTAAMSAGAFDRVRSLDARFRTQERQHGLVYTVIHERRLTGESRSVTSLDDADLSGNRPRPASTNRGID